MGAATFAHKSPSDNTITIPAVPGVVYKIGDEVVAGQVTIAESTTVTAEPAPGFEFPKGTRRQWRFVWRDEDPEE